MGNRGRFLLGNHLFNLVQFNFVITIKYSMLCRISVFRHEIMIGRHGAFLLASLGVPS